MKTLCKMDSPKLADYSDCTGCMLCADTCPKHAVSFNADRNGFWSPSIQLEKCIGCKLCEKKCEEVRSNEIKNICQTPLRGHAISDEVRLRSTSGGAFYAIAEHAILTKGAIVYGVVCEGTNVYHKRVDLVEGLRNLQGSKYAQSNICGVYKQVKKDLCNGKYVVFSGTPCQVNALRVFLNKEFDNLLCIDLICHGVPSNLLMYRHLAINHGDGVVQFRTKTKGWGRDSYVTIRRNGTDVVIDKPSQNLFYHAFQSEQCFRPSCYKCRFCDIRRTGDVTIGDFWAIRYSDEYDKLGESTILPNTKKGESFILDCTALEKKHTNWEEVKMNNPRLEKNREKFLRFSLSNRLGLLYKIFPYRLIDFIIEAWLSKSRHIFYIWAFYINFLKKKYEM